MGVAQALGVDPPDSSTIYSVGQQATPVTLLVANADRLGGSVCNESSEFLYLKFGTGVSSTSFSVKLPPRAFYELNFPQYTGVITGVWKSAGAGAALITEVF